MPGPVGSVSVQLDVFAPDWIETPFAEPALYMFREPVVVPAAPMLKAPLIGAEAADGDAQTVVPVPSVVRTWPFVPGLIGSVSVHGAVLTPDLSETALGEPALYMFSVPVVDEPEPTSNVPPVAAPAAGVPHDVTPAPFVVRT